MMLRTIKCCVCQLTYTEKTEGAGWPNWGQALGFAIDRDANPFLCPKHLTAMADYIVKLKEDQHNGVD